ncbi:MAG: hypothetical protein QM758_27450 [Armatimonas sp.]
MRLQAQAIEDKDTLKKLQEALKSGTATRMVEQQSDDSLLRLLTLYQQKRRFRWFYLAPFLALALLQILVAFGNLMNWWRWSTIQFHLFFLPFLFFQRKKHELSAEAWLPVMLRLESASLPTLLEAHRLKISPLNNALRTGLTKRLSIATAEELESLTPDQRKELVRFTLSQLHTLSHERNQAAIVGFLALATLKQPGAEHVSPNTISETHVNLRRAVEEYQTIMKAR